ncbi:hypothetical protein [Aquimarina sp. Aq78]|uniref:hypothetical protein n=1 Tax=Aquimarina sp. Aq78 TaxID=1191889 RepID=UPI000D0F8F57|nr:hypothetical protein [Aquimarina sp. Aq78]
MNILKSFRKPYFAILLSTLILFVSCEKSIIDPNESTTFQSAKSSKIENSFDYTIFKTLKQNSDITNILDTLSDKEVGDMGTAEKSENILKMVNSYYDTDIVFPNDFHQITDSSQERILNISEKKGWINQNDINLINQFKKDMQNSDFNTAIANYENTVLRLKLNNEEFAKKNNIANAFKTINYYNPEIFSKVDSCFGAIVTLVVATFGLLSCVTVVACGFAIVGYTFSYINYQEQCVN